MTTEPAASDHHPLTFEGIDSWFERLLGCDFRLLYGIGLPVFGLIALLIALAFDPQEWLVGTIVAFEVISLLLVVRGLMSMMSDARTDERDASPHVSPAP
jgi:hypothetical protein